MRCGQLKGSSRSWQSQSSVDQVADEWWHYQSGALLNNKYVLHPDASWIKERATQARWGTEVWKPDVVKLFHIILVNPYADLSMLEI